MPNATQAVPRDDTFSATQGHTPSEGDETVRLAWRIHPLRENPRGIAPVAGAYALAFLLWRLLFPHPFGLFVPVVALTGALSDYLFPTTYRLTTRGAHADGGISRLFIAWSDVKRVTRGADGVHLSPFSRASRLDSMRGVRLKLTTEVAEEAIAIIQQERSAKTNKATPAIPAVTEAA